MDQRHCYFAKEPPSVEVRGEMLFIIPYGAPCEIAVSAHTLGLFVAAASRAIREFHGRNGKLLEIKKRG